MCARTIRNRPRRKFTLARPSFLALLVVGAGCERASPTGSGMSAWVAAANTDGGGMAITQSPPPNPGPPADASADADTSADADANRRPEIEAGGPARADSVGAGGASPDGDSDDRGGRATGGGGGEPGRVDGAAGSGGTGTGGTGWGDDAGSAIGGGGAGSTTGDASPGTGWLGDGDGDAVAGADAVAAKRRELIQFLWGDAGFPTVAMPTTLEKDVVSPVRGLRNLGRVDTLHLRMDPGVESLAHHFIPAASRRNQLVILHHGHDVSFDDRGDADPRSDDGADDASTGYGLQATIDRLLFEGFSVLAVYMPGCLPPVPRTGATETGETGCTIPHEDIVATETTGSGMKFFLEPVAVYLNYLQARSEADDFPDYTRFGMIGLSGGGWTTTVYAALDPRITVSIPIAGSLPFPLRGYYSYGDEEQIHAAFYALAEYVDLYVLGGYGPGRRQIQVLNRYDSCCFGADPLEFNPPQPDMSFDEAVRGYEGEVRNDLARLAVGSFRLVIDELAPRHMISANTLAETVLVELEAGDSDPPRGSTPPAPAGPDGGAGPSP